MNWKPILTEQLEAQKKHYGEVAVLASAGDKFYTAEREMTEGVIKGIEYCIDALSAAPTPPAQEGQPVARVWYDGAGLYKATWLAGYKPRPGDMLYLHPADDKLRKAAEELLAAIEHYKSNVPAKSVDNLRAALEGK